jgi:phosphoribosylglycinamide formyltransferase 1
MRALVERASGYEVVLVASDKVAAPGLDVARSLGVPTFAFEARRAEFEEALDRSLQDHDIGTIALAGYMRILSPEFIGRWRGRIVNIHPSLLPKYRGLDTHAQAIAAGDKVSGCTVHIVTEEVDSGEILGASEVPIDPGDTPETLERRILAAEHALYPKILAEFAKR